MDSVANKSWYATVYSSQVTINVNQLILCNTLHISVICNISGVELSLVSANHVLLKLFDLFAVGAIPMGSESLGKQLCTATRYSYFSQFSTGIVVCWLRKRPKRRSNPKSINTRATVPLLKGQQLNAFHVPLTLFFKWDWIFFSIIILVLEKSSNSPNYIILGEITHVFV